MKKSFRLFLLTVACTSLAGAQMSTADEMFAFVLGIEGKSHVERTEFVKSQLAKMGIGFFTLPFDFVSVRGTDTLDQGGEDIVVRLGTGNKRLVVGAHFDAVDGSPGANDNGSGTAVLLELIKNFRDVPHQCTIDFVFFDREEDGLLGSQFYVQKAVDRTRHLGMINLDIEGTGNVVYVGPVGGGDDDFLMPLVRKAAQLVKFPYKEETDYPGSDFESFAAARLENISISVVPSGDPELLANMARTNGKIDSKHIPKVMKVMHTPDDRSDQMSPDALEISFEFTRSIIQFVDATLKSP